jgi:hypothetical protein
MNKRSLAAVFVVVGLGGGLVAAAGCSSSSPGPGGGGGADGGAEQRALGDTGAPGTDAGPSSDGAPKTDGGTNTDASPGGDGSGSGDTGGGGDAGSDGSFYSTDFPLTENPIAESGHWIGGSTAGGSLWGNMQTTPGLVFGVSEPTTYGDPIAILTGSWGQTQTAMATIAVSTVADSCCHEVELHLRMTISASSITGYEINCSVSNGDYLQVVRWNGANGDYTYLNTLATSCFDGDVLQAMATGTNPTTITVSLNGSVVLTASDTGAVGLGPGSAAGPFTSGNPGLGVFDDADNNWSYFGVSHFEAMAP